MSHMADARRSTPDGGSSSLHPPTARNGSGHHLRASADMGSFGATSSAKLMAPRSIRPLSEIYIQNHLGQNLNSTEDAADTAAQQWIADIDQYENTLEDMATATLDQDFKDELAAIEQWFRVLSEPERTASLYALIQQTTQVQIRFLIQVLQQMARNLPMSGVLSPANFGEKDAMSNRMNDAMSKINMGGSRNTSMPFQKPPSSPGLKRNSGLDPSTIKSMFPDAAAAIAKQKADYAEHTNNMASASRTTGVVGDRSSFAGTSLSPAPTGLVRSDSTSMLPPSPWNPRSAMDTFAPITRPKSSTSQHSQMGQFSQPLASAGLYSPRTRVDSTAPKATLDSSLSMNILSPYHGSGSWASMANTPLNPSFSTQNTNQVDMVTSATAMKLAAMSTVNNRIQLDDAKKYRRARSSGEPSPLNQSASTNSLLGTNIMMTNEHGQVLSPQAMATLQAQANQLNMQNRRASRPNSPGLPMQPGSAGLGGLPVSMSTPNGFLGAYDPSMLANSISMSNLHLGSYNPLSQHGNEDYISDHSDPNLARGRSPRGAPRRNISKPTTQSEDPTDLALMADVPAWLRALRLHKYTDVLGHLNWTDIVVLDDAGLQGKGVNALGARRKLLKVFEQVRELHSAAYPTVWANVPATTLSADATSGAARSASHEGHAVGTAPAIQA